MLKRTYSVLDRFIQFFIPESLEKDPEALRRARLVVLFSFLTAPWSPAFAAAYAHYSAPLGLVLFALSSSFWALLVPLVMKTTGSLAVTGNAAGLMVFMLMSGISWNDRGPFCQALLWLAFVPLIVTYVAGVGYGLLWTVVVVSEVIGLFVAYQHGYAFPVAVSPEGAQTLYITSVTGLFVTFALWSMSYERSRNRLYQIATLRAQDLEAKNLLIVEQQQSLLASSKMAALGEMAGSIAHEINTPLAVIQMQSGVAQKVLLQKSPDLQRADSSLQAISSTVFRIARIIKGLRDFSRDAENDPFETVPILAIVQDTLALCQEKFTSARISLSVGNLPSEECVRCRPIQVSQVLLNLLNNAYEAVKEGPRRWVKIEALGNMRNDEVVLAIEDGGSGIPAEIRSRIFQPFFTTKKLGEGTGMGLSISRGIIEAHDGRLELDETSANTRFILRLPKPRSE